MGVREQAIHLREEHPTMTLQAIGSVVGVTRERVRQILDGKVKHRIVVIDSRPILTIASCLVCHSLFEKKDGRKMCKKCSYPTLICYSCGKTFQSKYVASHHKKYKNAFCSRYCLGVRAGEEYGFAAHPENAGTHIYNKKAVFDALVKNTGTYKDLAKQFGMHETTMYHYVKKAKAIGLDVRSHQTWTLPSQIVECVGCGVMYKKTGRGQLFCTNACRVRVRYLYDVANM